LEGLQVKSPARLLLAQLTEPAMMFNLLII